MSWTQRCRQEFIFPMDCPAARGPNLLGLGNFIFTHPRFRSWIWVLEVPCSSFELGKLI